MIMRTFLVLTTREKHFCLVPQKFGELERILLEELQFLAPSVATKIQKHIGNKIPRTGLILATIWALGLVFQKRESG